ncbi:hypothetical protein [Nonomuraea wenchangensis]|uniref:hypothetical protein n=1 Tax=Nonomuraea wenchangensis TaxID=568860 RepID=UPI003449B3F0
MRISVAADSRDGVAERVVAELRRRGHEVITHGALDANVLALSLRLTSDVVLDEILDAWFAGRPSDDPSDLANISHLEQI